jgi:hypothetical protein
MDSKTTRNLTMALRPWLAEAIEVIKLRPDIIAAMRKSADGAGDVRVVFHIRENAISVEVVDYAESTVVEVFRQMLLPEDGGSASRIASTGPPPTVPSVTSGRKPLPALTGGVFHTLQSIKGIDRKWLAVLSSSGNGPAGRTDSQSRRRVDLTSILRDSKGFPAQSLTEMPKDPRVSPGSWSASTTRTGHVGFPHRQDWKVIDCEWVADLSSSTREAEHWDHLRGVSHGNGPFAAVPHGRGGVENRQWDFRMRATKSPGQATRTGAFTSTARANIVPSTPDAIAFRRTPQEVLHIVYLTEKSGVSKGGFYPNGMNGALKST